MRSIRDLTKQLDDLVGATGLRTIEIEYFPGEKYVYRTNDALKTHASWWKVWRSHQDGHGDKSFDTDVYGVRVC